jgi:hypothetical protein
MPRTEELQEGFPGASPRARAMARRVKVTEAERASWGKRPSGEPKDEGYFGPLTTKSGKTMTELTASSRIAGQETEYPLIVPTLTREELEHLLYEKTPTKEIERKAKEWAINRIGEGLSPFWTPGEKHTSFPKTAQKEMEEGYRTGR